MPMYVMSHPPTPLVNWSLPQPFPKQVIHGQNSRVCNHDIWQATNSDLQESIQNCQQLHDPKTFNDESMKHVDVLTSGRGRINIEIPYEHKKNVHMIKEQSTTMVQERQKEEAHHGRWKAEHVKERVRNNGGFGAQQGGRKT